MRALYSITFLALSLAFTQEQDAQSNKQDLAQQISIWIKRLKSEGEEVRESAQKELLRHRTESLKALRETANDEKQDETLRRRARYLVDFLTKDYSEDVIRLHYNLNANDNPAKVKDKPEEIKNDCLMKYLPNVRFYRINAQNFEASGIHVVYAVNDKGDIEKWFGYSHHLDNTVIQIPPLQREDYELVAQDEDEVKEIAALLMLLLDTEHVKDSMNKLDFQVSKLDYGGYSVRVQRDKKSKDCRLRIGFNKEGKIISIHAHLWEEWSDRRQ